MSVVTGLLRNVLLALAVPLTESGAAAVPQQASLALAASPDPVTDTADVLLPEDEAMIPGLSANDFVGGISGGVDAPIFELQESETVPGTIPGPISSYCRYLLQEAA